MDLEKNAFLCLKPSLRHCYTHCLKVTFIAVLMGIAPVTFSTEFNTEFNTELNTELNTEHQSNQEHQNVQLVNYTSSKPTTSLKNIKQKPWYTKINYFVTLGQDKQGIAVSRFTDNIASDTELFKGDVDATMVSFTAGGNLFNRTSVHIDLKLNKLTLAGNIIGVGNEFVRYQRNKSLAEFFVEHDLGQGVTLGFDLYYGGDFYKNQGEDEKFYDEELGGDLMAARAFKLGSSEARLDYILSHRRVNTDNSNSSTDDGKLSRSFHSLLFSLSHQWSYELSTELSSRVSYYPVYDLSLYWDARFVYSLSTEISYRLWGANELSLRVERMNFDGHSHVNSASLRFEHQFGVKKSKRRKRRNKIPNLLIN